MLGRRLLYIAALAGGIIFYFAYREWLGWIVLLWLLGLPWLSLLVSLPALLTAKVQVLYPNEILRDSYVVPKLEINCKYPRPVILGSLRVRHSLSTEQVIYGLDEPFMTDHCGVLEICPKHMRVCDYLGLFCWPLRHVAAGTVTVLPIPVRVETLPQLQRYLPSVWRPKPGGGFSENHDLRLYRPGDDLRHIHWKLTAKTGKLVYREPIVPVQGRFLLTLELSGDLDVLDKKMGRLLWISTYLQEKGIPHEVQCLTGRGLECIKVCDEASVKRAVRTLLGAPRLPDDAEISCPNEKCWTYHIGGEADAQG